MKSSGVLRSLVCVGYAPLRPAWAAYWRRRLGIATRPRSAKRRATVAALVRVRNEDVWIETILRTACKVYSQVVVVDNGSQDGTRHIVRCLIENDGLPITFFQYRDPLRNDSLILNELLNHVIDCEWFHIVDGDELLLEKDYKRIVAALSGPRMRAYSSVQLHPRYVHPQLIHLATRPFAPGIRVHVGRVFKTSAIRVYEPGFRDYPLIEVGKGGMDDGSHGRAFLEDVHFLHACFTQRSSLKSWQGWTSVDPGHQNHRLKRYFSDDLTAYAPILEFPKEFLECRHSPPNPYRDSLLTVGIAFV